MNKMSYKKARILLLFLLSLTGTFASGSEGTEFNVSINKDSFKFEPNRIVIEVGDTVNWVNQDERRHLTASVPDGKELEIFCPELYPGKVCSHTFTLPGRYPYFCFIHVNMVGEVVVLQ